MRMLRSIVLGCMLAVAAPAAMSVSAETHPAPAVVNLSIGAIPLDQAILQFAQQTGLQVSFYRSDVAPGLKSPALQGKYQPEEALKLLLANSGLQYKFFDERTVAIRTKGAGPIAWDAAKNMNVAQAGDGAHNSGISSGTIGEFDEQSSNDNNKSSPTEQLQEIVVTAQKREERLQDVPMSIAVIGNQNIERRGLIGMEDYLRSIPGVNQIDRGADNAIVIRGITTAPQSENFFSGTTVASYFDETPITAAAGIGAGGIDVRPVDIERIEVLRGPQGTTFGDASLGGAMRVIPVKPKLDAFSAKLAADYSNTGRGGNNNSMVQGVLNLPIVSNRFALRAVGYRYDESGFYRNIAGDDPSTIAIAESRGLGGFVRGFVQDHVGEAVSTGGRLSALWRATDKLDISLNYLTQKIEQDGRPEVNLGKYEQTRIPIAPQGRLRGEQGEVNDTEMDLYNAVLNYDMGWAKLTTVSSWIDGGSAYASDFSSALRFPASSTVVSGFESFSAEARLASKLLGRFQFLGGVYYEDVQNDFLQTYDWPGAPTPSPLGTNPVGVSERDRSQDQKAVFGEATYGLTDKLSMTVGGRFFKYEKGERILRREGGIFGVPLGGSVRQDLDSSDDRSSFKANLTYKPTQDILLYTAWAQGFRLGRPDVGATPSLCDRDGDGVVDGSNVTMESTRIIDSDFLDNYEIGGKFALFDRRMVVDASVYHIRWDGLPFRSTIGNCAYTDNAGAATSDGVELQASVSVRRGLRLDFGAGYTKAELAEDAPGLLPPAFKGDRLPGSPKLSANLSAQYEFAILGRNAFVRLDSFYTGKFYGDLQQSLFTEAGNYTKVDLRTGVAIGHLGLELFVRNLTDESAFTWRGLTNANASFGYRLRPRTTGVAVRYSFD